MSTPSYERDHEPAPLEARRDLYVAIGELVEAKAGGLPYRREALPEDLVPAYVTLRLPRAAGPAEFAVHAAFRMRGGDDASVRFTRMEPSPDFTRVTRWVVEYTIGGAQVNYLPEREVLGTTYDMPAPPPLDNTIRSRLAYNDQEYDRMRRSTVSLDVPDDLWPEYGLVVVEAGQLLGSMTALQFGDV